MIILTVASPETELDLGVALRTQMDTTQVNNQLVKVLCYPSGGAITVKLPPTDINPIQNMQVLVADASGDAGTNNVTVEAGLTLATETQEKINGLDSVGLEDNYAHGTFTILETGAWVGSTFKP